MITIPDGLLIDYTKSLTMGVIDPTIRWDDSLGGFTEKRHVPALPIADVDAYARANNVDTDSAICALVKASMAERAGVPIEQLTVNITPYTRSAESATP